MLKSETQAIGRKKLEERYILAIACWRMEVAVDVDPSVVAEELVSQLVAALGGLGAATVTEELSVAEENMHFKLPPEVRQRRSD